MSVTWHSGSGDDFGDRAARELAIISDEIGRLSQGLPQYGNSW